MARAHKAAQPACPSAALLQQEALAPALLPGWAVAWPVLLPLWGAATSAIAAVWATATGGEGAARGAAGGTVATAPPLDALAWLLPSMLRGAIARAADGSGPGAAACAVAASCDAGAAGLGAPGCGREAAGVLVAALRATTWLRLATRALLWSTASGPISTGARPAATALSANQAATPLLSYSVAGCGSAGSSGTSAKRCAAVPAPKRPGGGTCHAGCDERRAMLLRRLWR